MKDRIKALRLERKMTQNELARAIGVTRASVNAWESGASMPNAQCIIALARYFATSSDYLLGLDTQYTLCIDSMSDSEKEIIVTLAKCFNHI